MGIVHAKEPNIISDGGAASSGFYPTPKESTLESHDANWNTRHNDTFEDNLISKNYSIDIHQKARVDKIHIDGLMRTKDDIVEAQVADLFNAHDFLQVIDRTEKVVKKLETLGCFKAIGVSIDTSKGADATPNGVEVTFNVREMKRLSGDVGTTVGNNEGSLVVHARAPNIFGRGERLQVEFSYGSRSTTNFNISAVKPFVDNWLHKVFTTSVFSTASDVPWSGYKERDHGILFDLAVIPGILKQNFQYEIAYRDIIATKHASFNIREQCGPSLKSVLRHICSIDKRDDNVFPTTGNLVQFTSELAGLGGDIGFMKYELMLQSNWTPHEFLSFQLGAQAGFLSSISNDMQINIADHFFLGGPMNLRGFVRGGCGPHEDGNAMGGNTFWAAALHMYTPLPFRPGKNGFGDLFKLHGFINGGNLRNTTFSKGNYSECMNIFRNNVRLTAGGGIAMRLGGSCRIELNVVVPLLMARGDISQQYQFGLGLHYL